MSLRLIDELIRSTSAPGWLVAMGAPPEGGSLLQGIVPMVAIHGIFYFIILLPMRRKQQKVEEFLNALKVGDRVITSGGIYGQVTKLGDQSVQLKIAEKLRVEVAKSAISGYQGQPPVVEPSNE